jgi:sortase A
MRGAAKWVERALWIIGFLALAIWLAFWVNARRQQAGGSRELDRLIKEGKNPEQAPRTSPPIKLTQGDVIGRIEIPRLEISTIVFEGTGDDVLGTGVGHLTGSPLPGQRGNVVLAAHRDTFFRPLRNIRKRDTIAVVTPSGTRRYSVDETTIVTPDQTEVLGPASGEILTLVTCYPFDWFGHAPQRFIVRAHELGDPTHPAAIASAVRAQTPSAESDLMASVDHLAPVQLQPVLRPKPAVRRADKVQEPAEEIAAQKEAEPETLPHHQGNRVVHGVKKLNPKHLWARITGK